MSSSNTAAGTGSKDPSTDSTSSSSITLEQSHLSKKQITHLEEEVDDPATAQKKRRLLWKIDLLILPVLAMIKFLGSIGKSDLANAKIAGMDEDLGLSAQDYSNAANMYVVGQLVFLLPGTLLLRKTGPPNQFAAAMTSWGVVTTILTKITTPAQLLGLRFLVGAAEAFIEGTIFYLTFWYQYHELATRAAVFAGINAIAGGFNGLLSYGIAKTLNGRNGWAAWRWIFLVEGMMPLAGAIIVLIFLPISPAKARIGFSAEEKQMAIARSARSHNNLEEKLNMKKIHTPFLHFNFWLICLILCCGNFCTASLGNFLPAIIEGFGYSDVNSQIFTLVVYSSATFGLFFFGRISDVTNQRGLTLAAANCLSVLGYTLLLILTNDKARLAATCLLAFGLYSTTALGMVWVGLSTAGYTHRGASIAFASIFGQLFSLCGNQAYVDPPFYRDGNAAALSMCATGAVAAVGLRFYYKLVNARKRRDQYIPESNELRAKSFEELGTDHPDFFFHP